ncbi:MAG: hypothetical protein FVQ82_04225 [Planctomycetes bacterium]|nr:hypothetical protein [Planctomycetota bacterium]
MLDHNEIKELLAGYALGDLSDDQAKIIEEHVSQCQSCEQELESIRLVLECAGQMSKVSVDDDMCISAKEGLLSSLSPEQTQTTAAKTVRKIQWRTIMQSKITKFATAAVVILGVFLGMYVLGISLDGSSVAWASLADHVQKIKTVSYKMHMTMKGLPGLPKDKAMEMDTTILISSDYGMKMEMSMDGKVMSKMYMLLAEKSMISFMPEQKKYMLITLTDDIHEKMKKESNDPRAMVAEYMGLEYVDLGRKEIDGIEVEGIEVNDPKIGGGMFQNCIGRLWVEVETDLPVRIEMEFGSDKGMEIKGVIEDFNWDVALDGSEFAYTIPEDYEKMGEVVMPEMNAEAAIEGLKMLIDIYDGKFPKSLNMMELIQDVSKYRMEEMKQKMEEQKKAHEKAVEEATAAGIDPNTIAQVKPEVSKELQQKMIDDQMKMQGVCMFYLKLVGEKKDPAYYGDRITPADKDMILMRWLNDKDGYTVILGDLSIVDLTPEEVGEMEALLPEPPKPAEVEAHTHTHTDTHTHHPEAPEPAEVEEVKEVEELKPLPVVPVE